MNPHASALVQVAAPAAALSDDQSAFNELIAQVKAQRQCLLDWQATLPRYQLRHAREFAPLMQRFNAHREQLARLFDQAHDTKGITLMERAKLRELICEIAGSLIGDQAGAAAGRAGLVALHDKHSDVAFADTPAGIAHQEAVAAAAQAAIDEAAKKASESDEALAHDEPAQDESSSHEPQTPGEPGDASAAGATALLLKAGKPGDAAVANPSVREVYRRLASGLHPDREPDEAERARKTALMQRVNSAYANKDLLQLLELQAEAEQADPAALGNIPQGQLQHYHEVLTGQLAGLQKRVAHFEQMFQGQGAFREDPVRPDLVMQSLDTDIDALGTHIDNLEQDLDNFTDLSALKSWLKGYELQQYNGLIAGFFNAFKLF